MMTATRMAKTQQVWSQVAKAQFLFHFLDISLPLLHNHGMKLPNFMFYGGLNTSQRCSNNSFFKT